MRVRFALFVLFACLLVRGAQPQSWASVNGIAIGAANGKAASLNGKYLGASTGQFSKMNGKTATANSADGYTFTEGWNNAVAPQLCWTGGSSVCNQTWGILQGSAPTLVTAPSSGWYRPNVLEFTANATRGQISHMGTLQSIAGTGTTTDIWIEFYFDSASMGTSDIIHFDTYGGSFAYYFTYGGGGLCWMGNGSVQVACTANARHVLHVHLSGASSYDDLDSGTHNTFTASNAWYEVVLSGDTVANVYFGSVYMFNTAKPACATSPTALYDAAGTSSGTVTATGLNSGTHGGNGTWTLDTINNMSFAWGTASYSAFPSPLSVCQTSYTGSTGNVVVMTMPVAATSDGNLRYAPMSWSPNITSGFLWSYTETGLNNGVDFFGIGSSSGTIDNVQLDQVGSAQQICFENDFGSSSAPCINYNVAQSTWYWVTFGVSSTGADTVYLYSYPALTLLGSAASNGTDHTYNGPQVFFLLGKTGSEAITNAVTMKFADVMFDTTGTLPLLP